MGPVDAIFGSPERVQKARFKATARGIERSIISDNYFILEGKESSISENKLRNI